MKSPLKKLRLGNSPYIFQAKKISSPFLNKVGGSGGRGQKPYKPLTSPLFKLTSVFDFYEKWQNKGKWTFHPKNGKSQFDVRCFLNSALIWESTYSVSIIYFTRIQQLFRGFFCCAFIKIFHLLHPVSIFNLQSSLNKIWIDKNGVSGYCQKCSNTLIR